MRMRIEMLVFSIVHQHNESYTPTEDDINVELLNCIYCYICICFTNDTQSCWVNNATF